MKISYNWLKEYLKTNLSVDEMSSLLTGSGLEVESIEDFETIKGGLRGLVIGEVLEKTKHPGADRLSVTKVNVGSGEPLQIVCGAANVAAGQKVLVALTGAKLYPVFGDSFEIKKSKIRGEASEGMICAEDEVGLGQSHEGIMVLDSNAQVGLPAAKYFKIESDSIFEIGLTPNRADAASHMGVARDLCSVINTHASYDKTVQYNKAEFVVPDVTNFNISKTNAAIDVSVEDSAACPRYSGITISGISVKESPAWLKNRLISIGLKPINNVVDISNFVLFETGQPLHAFDTAAIKDKKIVVKKLNNETSFITLDGVERKLSGTELMICNSTEPMCIAGVFGGIKSGVTEKTKEIFLESAYFNAADIRKAAKIHGLKTDASFRFERGTDPNGNIYALKRAALLIKEIAGGEVTSPLIDIYPVEIQTNKVFLNYHRFNVLSGLNLPHDVIKNILAFCNMPVVEENAEGVLISVSTYKVDVTREADVVEEILRTYGYEHIPIPQKVNVALSGFKTNSHHELQKKISGWLSANGFYETLNNSLTKSAYAEKYNAENHEQSVKLLNPLSNDLNVLRQTLLFSSLESVQYNLNRKNEHLRFYEFGKTYRQEKNSYVETNSLSLTVSGIRNAENWHKQNQPFSFFYLKSVIENVLAQFGNIENHYLHFNPMNNGAYGLALAVSYNHNPIGMAGIIKKSVLKNFDIDQKLFYAELNVDAVSRLFKNPTLKVKEIAKFPTVKRDLSMVIDKNTNYADIRNLAFQSEKKLLKGVNIFDVFEGKGFEEGKKSYALSFVLGDDEKTLEEKQIDGVMNKLIQTFETKIGAQIRK